ncbi:MAG: hypothetical protein ACXIUM_14510 [Wenzhouxiangella sp.]
MRSFQAGQYFSAKSKFKAAARWCDKLSQFNLGVMNYHGQGTPQDPARAWAWFSLSAERGYPIMVEMADQLYRQLSEAQRAQARSILENDLAPVFADKVAIERTARRMERERRRATGSRVGAVGALTVIDSTGRSRTGREFFRRDAWDIHQIIERERELFLGLDRRVVLRDLADGEAEIDEPDDAEP